MTAKSPPTPTSIRRREIIGGELFSQRREVFDKHDTVFLPASPTGLATTYREMEPELKPQANFRRNTPGYSSMREARNEEREPVRARKYSDNFASENNQGDDDYRRSLTERTRRLSKMRKDFLASNLHDNTDNNFTRSGMRASLPARSGSITYKIDSPTIYKFPFPEPYTPTPVRRLFVDPASPDGVEVRDGKENEDPEKANEKYQSLPAYHATTKLDGQKLFEELVKRYSPNRKPVDWTLPPTRPRVVATIPKPDTTIPNELHITENGDIKDKSNNNNKDAENKNQEKKNLPDVVVTEVSTDSKVSLTELAEKNDRVPELSIIQRQTSREASRKTSVDKDLNIPALIEKMTVDGQDLEKHTKDNKKVKRKRSFLDKLLGRKKESNKTH